MKYALVFFLSLATLVQAETVNVHVTLIDGSKLVGEWLQETLDIDTKYNLLKIPVSEVVNVDVAPRLTPDEKVKFDRAVRDLSSETYAVRQHATSALTGLGRRGAFVLQSATITDLEAQERSRKILAAAGLLEPPGCSPPVKTVACDTILAKQFTPIGTIVGTHLKLRTAHLGEQTVALAAVENIRVAGGQARLIIDAGRHGSPGKEWHAAPVVLSDRRNITIIASGNVDLWPMGPGQYICTPKGFSTTGQGGIHMAGSLIGKYGEAGEQFVIGERYTGVTKTGRLYLWIVPSPWNNNSSGSYEVNITVE